jgi:predicted alpha/beta hydrolase family esterase
MKNAVLLHGTAASSRGNWLPWLKGELEKVGWSVWVPDLPGAEAPNIERYNEFLFESGYDFNEDTVLIGHSSGAVEILGLLDAFPEGKRVRAAVLVGAFKDDLGREDLKGLFIKPFDFEKIKSRATQFILVHSDDDPFCPLEGAEFIATKLEGELLLQKGQKHFSVGTAGEKYKEFPYLLGLLKGL